MPSRSARLRMIAEGRVGGLLHHVPQVAGELHLAGAGDHVDLHLQQLAAHRGPGQAVDHAHRSSSTWRSG